MKLCAVAASDANAVHADNLKKAKSLYFKSVTDILKSVPIADVSADDYHMRNNEFKLK